MLCELFWVHLFGVSQNILDLKMMGVKRGGLNLRDLISQESQIVTALLQYIMVDCGFNPTSIKSVEAMGDKSSSQNESEKPLVCSNAGYF